VRDLLADRMAALVASGAAACDSPAQAARGAGALIVCVVDADQCAQVLFGPQGAAGELAFGSPILLCPTIAPQDVEALSARLAGIGLLPVDAPMSGGPARARDGSMSLMLACTDEAFACANPLVSALSTQVFRVGRQPGDGARTKLVNNLLAGINLVAAAEALALARRLGLELDTTLDVIERSSGQSWIGSDRMRRAIAGDYEPRAHVTLLAKDTRLAVEAAVRSGFAGPLGPLARDVFAMAIDQGWAHLDDAVLLRLLEELGEPKLLRPSAGPQG